MNQQEKGWQLLKRAIDAEDGAQITALLDNCALEVEAFTYAALCDKREIARLVIAHAQKRRNAHRFAFIKHLAAESYKNDKIPESVRKTTPFLLYSREELFALSWIVRAMGAMPELDALIEEALAPQQTPVPYCTACIRIHSRQRTVAAAIALILHDEEQIIDTTASAALLKAKPLLSPTENLMRAYLTAVSATTQSIRGPAYLQIHCQPVPQMPKHVTIDQLLAAPEVAPIKKEAAQLYPVLTRPEIDYQLADLLATYAQQIAASEGSEKVEELTFALQSDLQNILCGVATEHIAAKMNFVF